MAEDERCRETIAAYIDAFNRRDIEGLGAFLADDVTLVDWEVSASGKEAVMETTNRIVSGADLRILVHGTVVELPRAVADLTVVINGATELKVLDLFEFATDGLIASIRAFRGPERPHRA